MLLGIRVPAQCCAAAVYELQRPILQPNPELPAVPETDATYLYQPTSGQVLLKMRCDSAFIPFRSSFLDSEEHCRVCPNFHDTPLGHANCF